MPPKSISLGAPLDFPKAGFQPMEEPPVAPATGIPFPPATETLQVIPATSDTSGGLVRSRYAPEFAAQAEPR